MKSPKLDISLVNKAKEGDTIAFRAIVETYKDPSLSLACSIMKNEQEAEDVLQEAFIKVYKSLSSFRADANFATWLFRIVVNTSNSALRKRRWKIEVKEECYQPDEMKISDQNFYVNKALLRMKKDESLTLRLHYLNELSIQEIQEVTGHGMSKIKMDLSRGRNNFKKELQKLLGNESYELL